MKKGKESAWQRDPVKIAEGDGVQVWTAAGGFIRNVTTADARLRVKLGTCFAMTDNAIGYYEQEEQI